ncbi:hypothetical protein [Pseudoroseicyclus tamaricis]|uniref:Reverse transcriptase (RNA-dependent DNA polymerase) n=1 Tax=Pseudoroseicyclus tamaricis TaxID=2705421 RepID=A0A6B2K4V0_9RHOB|nr:hypothetical protein [Pseudoroseicyclus tamaricis]NDV02892.1 hypothetical protein [Pseudoroseicyclus tamaricis]
MRQAERHERKLAKQVRAAVQQREQAEEGVVCCGIRELLDRLRGGDKIAAKLDAAIDAELEAKRRYLESYNCKLVAANEARKRYKGQLCDRLEDIARYVDVYRTCDEPVRHIIEKKLGGGERQILSFGMANRTRQALVRNLIRAMHGLTPGDHMLFHGGAPAAIGRIKSLFDAGYQQVAQLDVKECYASFNVDLVAELLGLDEEVAFNVLSAEAANIVSPMVDTCPSGTREAVADANSKVRQGLSTGSMVSPLVAEWMLTLARLNLADCGDVQVTCYADNFLLQSRSSRVLGDAVPSLGDGLRNHPAGPLLGHKFQTLGNYEEFEFLGCRLHKDGGRLTVSLSDANYEKARKIRATGYRDIAEASSISEVDRVIDRVAKEHRAFVCAFVALECRQRFHRKRMEAMRAKARNRVRLLSGEDVS